MKNVLILILGIVALAACSDDDINDWDDTIELSTKSANFDALADSITISTKGTGWWIENVAFEGSVYYGSISQDTIDYTQDTYTLESEYFIVERQDENTLFIKLNDNNSGSKRIMDICLQGGNYFDHVYITQSAE